MRFNNHISSVGEAVEAALTEKLGGNVRIESAGCIGGGCINHASEIKTNAGTFFLKWNDRCPPDIFLREAECLEELGKAAKGLLVVPQVIAARQVDAMPGFLILEFLQPGYSGNDQQELLGRGLAVIHKHKSENFGFCSNNYCGLTPQNNTPKASWPEFFRDNRLRFLLDLIRGKRPFPSNERKIYDRLLAKIPDLVPESSSPVLIHGDLWSGNFMNTAQGPALIDPASCFADREMEMGIMTMFGGFSARFYHAYYEENPLPEDWKERNPLYQLYHVLNHYYLFGGGYGSQAFQIAQHFAGG